MIVQSMPTICTPPHMSPFLKFCPNGGKLFAEISLICIACISNRIPFEFETSLCRKISSIRKSTKINSDESIRNIRHLGRYRYLCVHLYLGTSKYRKVEVKSRPMPIKVAQNCQHKIHQKNENFWHPFKIALNVAKIGLIWAKNFCQLVKSRRPYLPIPWYPYASRKICPIRLWLS